MSTNETTKWVLDPSHSTIGFKVKHLMISNVSGRFNEVKGEFTSSTNDLKSAGITVTINASSIYTEAADRDAHLKSPDFFDSANYPELVFKADGLKPVDDENYELDGQLTIKGVTKPVKLAVEYGGLMTDPWGNVKSGFTVTGKINRKDWGLNWNATLEAGGVLVSDEVKILAEVQFAKVSAN
jgi:polyisoprenoid-binding protein YceI